MRKYCIMDLIFWSATKLETSEANLFLKESLVVKSFPFMSKILVYFKFKLNSQ